MYMHGTTPIDTNKLYWAAKNKNKYKKFELMLTKRAKAYSSSGSVV